MIQRGIQDIFCPQFHAVLKYRLIHLRILSNQEPSLF